jgi:hypothetical protein
MRATATIQLTTIELVMGKPNGLAISVAFCDSPSSWSCGAVLAGFICSASLAASAERVGVPVFIAEEASGLKLKTAIARAINVNLVLNLNTWPGSILISQLTRRQRANVSPYQRSGTR